LNIVQLLLKKEGMNDMDNNKVYDVTAIKEKKRQKKWFNLSSPVGFVLFINGLVIFAILTRYLFLN